MTKADTPTNTANLELVDSVNSTTVAPTDSSQHQELAAIQEQVKHLWHELETSHQTVQRQQILIETLMVQIESSQERVAQLEREFALNQQRYNEQSYQLVQAENTCRELRARLNRQQSQTLQLKAALEKCLEVPLPHYQFQADTEPPTSLPPVARPLHNFKPRHELPPLLLSNAQPIPVWSAQLESDQEELSSPELRINVSPELPPAARSPKPNSNWPSPVVYPLRPPKGRQSFAAVELPTF